MHRSSKLSQGMKKHEGKQSAAMGQKTQSAEVMSDSDCELMEPQVSVIELNDSLEGNDSVDDSDITIIEETDNVIDLVDDDEEEAIPENDVQADVEDDEVDEESDGEVDEDGEADEDDVRSETEENAEVATICTVSFYDAETFNALGESIKSAVVHCLQERSMNVDVMDDEKGLTLKFVEKSVDEDDGDLNFAIDTTPAAKPEVSAIPSYRRSIREVFNDEKKKEVNEDECLGLKRMSMCFNCNGSHSVRECPEPKNQQRINKARKMRSGKTERYHVDIEQRFAHIKPGRISFGLRKALGLRNHDVPQFIYNMRLLGYPPGWLEDAKVSHSGLTLFDSEGRQVQGSDEEAGEVNEDKHKYDVRKIISFPGFNCALEPGLFDDPKRPSMRPEDQKERFIKSLGGNIIKGYKRKKLKNLNASETENSQEAEVMDMEIESEVTLPVAPPANRLPQPPPSFLGLHPLPLLFPTHIRPPPPLPPPSEDRISPPHPPPEDLPPGTPPPKGSTQRRKKSRKSPTLEALEAKQRALLQALENSGPLLEATADDSLIDEILELSMENCGTEKQATQSTQSDEAQTNSQASSYMSTVLGTPVLKFSPYDKLPTGDQFSQGVSDVINFENLPDSTGKYVQMAKVIKKVRKAVQKCNEEN